MINPFGAPVGDFGHPLEMLHACHERMRRRRGANPFDP